MKRRGEEASRQTVAFLALIRSAQVKSLVSGDKSLRVVLEIDDPRDELVSDLNRLHRPDEHVAVVVAENKD